MHHEDYYCLVVGTKVVNFKVFIVDKGIMVGN